MNCKHKGGEFFLKENNQGTLICKNSLSPMILQSLTYGSQKPTPINLVK